MAILESYKKQFMRDGLIIVVVILGLFIFAWWKGRSLPGWEIKDEERIEGSEEKVEESIFIHDGGSLTLDDATLTFLPGTHNSLGMSVSGDSRVELTDSRIDSEEFQYFIFAGEEDDKSPEIKIEDSTVTDHSGIYLHNRSKFEAINSTIEELQMHDRSRASLAGSKIYPVFFSDEKEVYEGLSAGEDIDLEIEAEEGWKLSLENCEVWGYQIDIYEDNDVTIKESKDVVLSFHSPGELGDDVDVNLAEILANASGEFDKLGFELVWENTQFDMINYYGIGSDSVKFSGGLINELTSEDEAEISLNSTDLYCNVCVAQQDSVWELDGVTVKVDEDQEPILILNGNAEVTIRNSDIRELSIIMMGNSNLTLENCQLDEEKIENEGKGELNIM